MLGKPRIAHAEGTAVFQGRYWGICNFNLQLVPKICASNPTALPMFGLLYWAEMDGGPPVV